MEGEFKNCSLLSLFADWETFINIIFIFFPQVGMFFANLRSTRFFYCTRYANSAYDLKQCIMEIYSTANLWSTYI